MRFLLSLLFIQAAMSYRAKTLCIIKPDAVELAEIGSIVLDIIMEAGIRPVASAILSPAREVFVKHYIQHQHEAFFPWLIEYMMSGPVLVVIFEDEPGILSLFRGGIVKRLQIVAGTCGGPPSNMFTIRSKCQLSTRVNTIHSSDSDASAAREIALWAPLLEAASGSFCLHSFVKKNEVDNPLRIARLVREEIRELRMAVRVLKGRQIRSGLDDDSKIKLIREHVAVKKSKALVTQLIQSASLSKEHYEAIANILCEDIILFEEWPTFLDIILHIWLPWWFSYR